MIVRTDILYPITLLLVVIIGGCAAPGGYTLVEDKSELPSITEEYSGKLSEIHAGMSRQDVYALFPYLYFKDQQKNVTAYELVDYETYVTTADIRHQNFWYGAGTPKPRTIRRALWFYFLNDKLIKWDEPRSWPDISTLTQESREAKPILQATDLRVEEMETAPAETPSPTTTRSGTCFAISEDGLFVTAYNIVKGAQSIRVYLKQDAFELAEIVRFDAMNNLAVLKTEASTPHFLDIAPIQSVNQGDTVFTVGFPTLSEGRYAEGVIGPPFNPVGASSLLQINVPVEPGNSGGALINTKGFVVGIITSKEAIQPYLQDDMTVPEDVNWAVKADYLRLLIDLPIPQEEPLTADQIIKRAQMSTYPIVVE
jgi:hypothetical protein